MAFCQNCGNKLNPEAKFCPECGEPVAKKDMTKRKIKFAGEIIKCPNCGEIMDAFCSRCSACGYELRNSDSSEAIKEFVQELKRIEAGRIKEKDFEDSRNMYAMALKACSINTVDQQLANSIANFSVPNTKEDIFEFMILAASNIDPMAYDITSKGYGVSERAGKRMISNAWDSKYNQVYQKAKMMFPEDARLGEIENLYKSKKRQIKNQNSQIIMFLVASFGLMFAVLVASFGVLGGLVFNEVKLERKLNATVAEIQEDISNGDYDDALIKANGLRYDRDWNSDKAEQWAEQREYLINLINEKKGKN